MCGIAGFAGFEAPGLLARMCAAIRHRGPDGEGMVERLDTGISLGMRRLAIIDIAGGDQPMSDPDGQVDLVYNGEIYNFLEVRRILEAAGYAFRTRSDTEVLLVAYLHWGNDFLEHLHGMFAFALADRRGAVPTLILGRDRTGIKPLYYAVAGERLVFASEIKALLEWPDLDRSVRLKAVRDYLALRYVPGPESLFESVRKLPAGNLLTYRGGQTRLKRWWQPPQPAPVRSDGGASAAARLGDALEASVARHLVSDVPVGAFLSGGIDSGVIVALMARAADTPVHSFSIGIEGAEDADTLGAAVTARALGTAHTRLACTADDMGALQDIAWALDEPVGDPIVVPMYVLAREAAKDVKVVLSGEGADEILGGYEFHRRLVQLARLKRALPARAWPAAAAAVKLCPPPLLDVFFDYPGRLGEEGRRKVAELLKAIGREELAALYRRSVSLFDTPQIVALSAQEALARDACRVPGPPLDAALADGLTPLQALVQAQFPDWLPDDILMKADKMSMAHSLEARVPFMDAAVIASAASLDDTDKLRAGTGKLALRRFAETLLPAEIVRRRKRAFYFPLERFAEAPAFRALVARTLDPARIARRGLFRPEAVQSLRDNAGVDGFLNMKRLFSLVMLELWFERFAPDQSWR